MSDAIERKITHVDAETGEVLDACPFCELAERELRGKRLVIANLKGQLDDKRSKDPRMDDARQVFAHYCKVFGKRANYAFDSDRQDMILGALKMKGADKQPAYDVAKLKKAIDGRALKPWCGKHGWSADPYPGAKRFDKLEHCVGNADRIDDCMAAVDERNAAILANVPKPAPRAKPIDAVLHAIHEVGCELVDGDPLSELVVVCPAFHEGARQGHLTITVTERGGVKLDCDVPECHAMDVADALGLSIWRILPPEPDRTGDRPSQPSAGESPRSSARPVDAQEELAA